MHQRRGKNVHPVISFTEETVFAGKKDEFLSRGRNKQNIIDLISEKLRGKGCEVINAPGDADVQTVKAAVLSSLTRSTTLIGEDTDPLVLLLHYMQQANKDLYFRSDKANADKLYHINELKIVLGEELCSQLLFLHAYTGCDTTSKIFGVGKKSVFHKMVKGGATLKDCATSFLLSEQTAASIVNKGCQTMAVIFWGTRTDFFSSLRYNVLGKKVVSSQSFVTPKRLPPTESSTKFHCLRVYYQIMVWLGQESDMDTCEWGCQFVPTESDMNADPDSLLKIIHCNCTTACSTSRSAEQSTLYIGLWTVPTWCLWQSAQSVNTGWRWWPGLIVQLIANKWCVVLILLIVFVKGSAHLIVMVFWIV